MVIQNYVSQVDEKKPTTNAVLNNSETLYLKSEFTVIECFTYSCKLICFIEVPKESHRFPPKLIVL